MPVDWKEGLKMAYSKDPNTYQQDTTRIPNKLVSGNFFKICEKKYDLFCSLCEKKPVWKEM